MFGPGVIDVTKANMEKAKRVSGGIRRGTLNLRLTCFVRPNVEVNRRAEGTSELNRRLGDGEKGDWALERCGAEIGRAHV